MSGRFTQLKETQSQRAGDNSAQNQIVVHGNVSVGASSADVERLLDRAVADARLAANEVARDRIDELKAKLVESGVLVEEGVALAEPNCIAALDHAARQAGIADGADDISILAALVERRVEEHQDRIKRAAVDRAIEIIPSVSEPALVGLTALYLISVFSRSTLSPIASLKVLDRACRISLADRILPGGTDWLEHLDLLGAVRYSNDYRMVEFDNWLVTRHAWLLSPGLDKNSPEYDAAWSLASTLSARRGGATLVAAGHPFKQGFEVLPYPDIESVTKTLHSGGSDPQIDVDSAVDLAKRAWGVGQVDSDARARFLGAIPKFEMTGLADAGKWWNTIQGGFEWTEVGRLVAAANLRALSVDERIPEGAMYVHAD